MGIRYKCVLREGVKVERGAGTAANDPTSIRLYGDGPWVNGGKLLTLEDVAERTEYELASEPVTLEGRDAPGGS